MGSPNRARGSFGGFKRPERLPRYHLPYLPYPANCTAAESSPPFSILREYVDRPPRYYPSRPVAGGCRLLLPPSGLPICPSIRSGFLNSRCPSLTLPTSLTSLRRWRFINFQSTHLEISSSSACMRALHRAVPSSNSPLCKSFRFIHARNVGVQSLYSTTRVLLPGYRCTFPFFDPILFLIFSVRFLTSVVVLSRIPSPCLSC